MKTDLLCATDILKEIFQIITTAIIIIMWVPLLSVAEKSIWMFG
jgi:hypothetical protein